MTPLIENKTEVSVVKRRALVIPEQITIIDTTYTIILSNDYYHRTGNYGSIFFPENKIYLQKPNREFSSDFMWQVFWHEVVHGIFSKTGRHDLSGDEAFVDLMASCLNQVFLTGFLKEGR